VTKILDDNFIFFLLIKIKNSLFFHSISWRSRSGSVTPGHRGDPLKNYLDNEKRTDIWHLVLWVKRSCSRSRHLVLWSLETLTGQQKFYGTELVTQKGKMLSPPKRPTWGRLFCWFCLKLLRICSPFPFFYSPFNFPDSGVSEQFLRIFQTLALVNIAQIQKIWYSWL